MGSRLTINNKYRNK